jgi:hypothetical protein
MQQAQKKRDAEKKAREDREAARLKALTLFPLPFPNAKEANAFRDKEGLGLEDKKEDQVTSMFFIDLHFFALREACWLGDEKLCELTFGKFVAAP